MLSRLFVRSCTAPSLCPEHDEERRAEPELLPLCCSNFTQAADYALRTVGIAGNMSGIGIIAARLSALDGINTVMNYSCERFRFVTIYTAELDMADELADRMYDKYGCTVMVQDISEAPGCRYPVTADFDLGHMRCGRDLCIAGTDEHGIVRA